MGEGYATCRFVSVTRPPQSAKSVIRSRAAGGYSAAIVA